LEGVVAAGVATEVLAVEDLGGRSSS
jgi:hypothetical protein